MHLIRSLALVALGSLAMASQVHLQELDEAAGSFTGVVVVTVLSAQYDTTTSRFAGGAEHITSIRYDYRCRVDRVLRGEAPAAETTLSWSVVVAAAYDENGAQTMTWSPISSGSGSESTLQVGATYAVGVHAVRDPERCTLQRAEPVDQAEAMAAAFDAARSGER